MLVLARKAGESVQIDNDTVITVLSVQGDKVKLGFEAPTRVRIIRTELLAAESQPANSESNQAGSMAAS